MVDRSLSFPQQNLAWIHAVGSEKPELTDGVGRWMPAPWQYSYMYADSLGQAEQKMIARDWVWPIDLLKETESYDTWSSQVNHCMSHFPIGMPPPWRVAVSDVGWHFVRWTTTYDNLSDQLLYVTCWGDTCQISHCMWHGMTFVR